MSLNVQSAPCRLSTNPFECWENIYTFQQHNRIYFVQHISAKWPLIVGALSLFFAISTERSYINTHLSVYSILGTAHRLNDGTHSECIILDVQRETSGRLIKCNPTTWYPNVFVVNTFYLAYTHNHRYTHTQTNPISCLFIVQVQISFFPIFGKDFYYSYCSSYIDRWEGGKWVGIGNHSLCVCMCIALWNNFSFRNVVPTAFGRMSGWRRW